MYSLFRCGCMAFAFLSLLIAGCDSKSPKVNSDTTLMIRDSEKIQGAWTLTRSEDNGQTEIPEMVWTFNAGDYTIEHKAGFREGSYRLDPDKNPKTFDHWATAGKDQDKYYYGIYNFVDDDLVLCFGRGETRPKEFTGVAGSGQVLWVFKRKKV